MSFFHVFMAIMAMSTIIIYYVLYVYFSVNLTSPYSWTTSQDTIIPITNTINPVAEKINPIYIEFLDEAEHRTQLDFSSSHTRGKRGVVIGPTGGKFAYTIKAIQNARRIRNIIGNYSDIKIALITEQRHIQLLQYCNTNTSSPELTTEYCRMWANNTLFDDIIQSKEPPWTNDNHTKLVQGTSHYWMTALSGYLLAPYTTTLFLDSDAYPCPGFQKIFAMTKPFSHKL